MIVHVSLGTNSISIRLTCPLQETWLTYTTSRKPVFATKSGDDWLGFATASNLITTRLFISKLRIHYYSLSSRAAVANDYKRGLFEAYQFLGAEEMSHFDVFIKRTKQAGANFPSFSILSVATHVARKKNTVLPSAG